MSRSPTTDTRTRHKASYLPDLMLYFIVLLVLVIAVVLLGYQCWYLAGENQRLSNEAWRRRLKSYRRVTDPEALREQDYRVPDD